MQRSLSDSNRTRSTTPEPDGNGLVEASGADSAAQILNGLRSSSMESNGHRQPAALAALNRDSTNGENQHRAK